MTRLGLLNAYNELSLQRKGNVSWHLAKGYLQLLTQPIVSIQMELPEQNSQQNKKNLFIE